MYAQVRAYFRVIGYYFPLRFWSLLPLFLLRVLVRTWEWNFSSDTRHICLSRRAWACVMVTLWLPGAVFRHGVLRIGPPLRRMSVLPRTMGKTDEPSD
jgi:hypothetical protein